MTFRQKHALKFAIAAAVAGCLCACSTPAERQAAEARKAAPKAVVVKSQSGARVGGGLPRSADGYPTFDGPLTAANVQMSNDQAKAMQAQMDALAARRHSGAISEAEYQRRVGEMRKLAATHGSDTLSEINN